MYHTYIVGISLHLSYLQVGGCSTQESCSTLTSLDDVDQESLQSESTNTELSSLPPCVVCGDKSSGKHYGQLTCEGELSFHAY